MPPTPAPPILALFAVATLAPLPLIALAALQGGPWGWAALIYMTVFAFALDEAAARVAPALPGSEFPVADALSLILALGHFALLALTVAALGGPLAAADKAVLFLAAGIYFGQVSNSNAHELIHRGRRVLHGLGMWVYISLLFGHHTSAHVLIHHRHVGTRADPSTARRGESYYRFALRAWRGSFRAGLAAERERLARVGRGRWRNPYVVYLGGALAMIALAAVIGGRWGLAGYIGLALFAQGQLLMSDYIQHYGLTRAVGADGRAEPVADRHSWNAPHVFSAALMLNAPRHSDHHAHPARPYPALRLAEGPMLPRSLPAMACIALVPRAWRRVMDPRAADWAGPSPKDERGPMAAAGPM